MVIINNNHSILNNRHRNDSDKYRYGKFYHIFFNVLLWNEYCLYMLYAIYIMVFGLFYCNLNKFNGFFMVKCECNNCYIMNFSYTYWWVCSINDLFGVIYIYCLIMMVWNSGLLINGKQTVWFRKGWLFFVFIFILFFTSFFVFCDLSVFLKWLEDEINHQLLMRLFVFEAPFGRLRR